MQKLRLTVLSVAITSLLTACGGGDEPEYSIGGTATGITSAVTLEANDGNTSYGVNIDQNGTFEFDGSFVNGTELTMSLIEPRGNSCTLSEESITVSANIDDLELSCEQFGSIQGTVKDYSSGEPIEAAKLSFVITTEAGEEEIATTETDAEGNYTASELGYESNIIVKSVAANYIPRIENIATSEEDNERRLLISLNKAEVSSAFSGSQGATVASDESELSVAIEPGALVDAEGNVVSGNINAVAANVDASSDRGVLPGSYQTKNSSGELVPIEVFGAITVDFFDESGASLNLVEGSQSVINIPVAQLTRSNQPQQTVTLYSLNETTGDWAAEGEAELVLGENDEQMYRSTVSHFSTWAVGDSFDSVNITGCVETPEQEGVMSSTRVVLSGDDYIGSDEVEISDDGSFSVEARPNSKVLITVEGDETQSNTVVLDVAEEDFQMTNCLNASDEVMTIKLTWGERPEDLDSHFNGPKVANSDSDRFHIYFGSRNATVNGDEIFLDVDDITSYGPEIITVPDFTVAGEYNYFIHHYYGDSNIEASPARVEVNYKGERLVFAPTEPAETKGILNYDDANQEHLSAWQPFKLLVNEEGEVQLIEVNEYLHFNLDSISNDSSSIMNGASSSSALKSLNSRNTK